MSEYNIRKEGNKIYKRDVLAQINAESGLPYDMIRAVYDTLWDVIIKRLANGDTVILNGIGTFSMKYHKGHKSYFKETEEGNNGYTNDYYALKFAPAQVTKDRIREDMKLQMNAEKL